MGLSFSSIFKEWRTHTHTHTSQNSREIYDPLIISFFWHFASLSLSLFILLFKTLSGFAKVGFSSGAWSSCLHTSIWTSNMHEYLKGKLTKRIEDAHWQFEKTEWVYQSWTIILKNNCPKKSDRNRLYVSDYLFYRYLKILQVEVSCPKNHPNLIFICMNFKEIQIVLNNSE